MPKFNNLKLKCLNKKLLVRSIIGGIAFLLLFSSDAIAATLTTCDVDLPVIDQLIGFLPSSPESLKLSNILTEFAIQAPIGSSIIFEAYSGCFQILGIIAFFKAIRILVDIKSLIKF